MIARGRRPAPEGTTTGSGGAHGRGRGADVRGAGQRRSEEAGAEDGGVDRLGRRTRRGPDGGGGVGDGRRLASIDLVGGGCNTLI